jgi:uncharacterized damage-inducible protein DinB
MRDIQIIEEFERSWEYLRKMTTTFIEGVPDEKWAFSHHEKFAPLNKQFCHIVKVYGCYIDAAKTKKLDLKKKNSFYSGKGDRISIQESLKALDQDLAAVLAKLKETGLEGFVVDLFGMKMGFTEFTHVMIQHEVGHFGIWANYAAFGGFPTPAMWQSDWKL